MASASSRAVESYFESTSGVKNNSKGQSTEYSRAMPSQPSREISEAFDKAERGFRSVWSFAFGASTWEDLTVNPNEGILIVDT
jgi:hypothetical protein